MATWDYLEKTGSATGYPYNEIGLLYNSPTDPDGYAIIYYNGQGTAPVWVNTIKN